MAVGDFKVRTIRYSEGHKAMLLRITRHGEEEVLSGYDANPSMALRKLYLGGKKILALIEEAGKLSVRLEDK